MEFKKIQKIKSIELFNLDQTTLNATVSKNLERGWRFASLSTVGDTHHMLLVKDMCVLSAYQISEAIKLNSFRGYDGNRLILGRDFFAGGRLYNRQNQLGTRDITYETIDGKVAILTSVSCDLGQQEIYRYMCNPDNLKLRILDTDNYVLETSNNK